MNKSFFFLINRFQNHIILTNSIDYIYDSKRFSLLVRFNITTVYRESERNNVKFWILSTIQYATIKRQWATTIAKRSTLFPFGKYFSFLLLFLSFLLPPFSRNEITVSIFNRFLFIIHFDRKTLSLSRSTFHDDFAQRGTKAVGTSKRVYIYRCTTPYSVESDDSIRK